MRRTLGRGGVILLAAAILVGVLGGSMMTSGKAGASEPARTATPTVDASARAASALQEPLPEVWYPAPGINPPGANDFSCQPSSARPNPVVLVHGTFSDMTFHWQYVSPQLKRQGYCVFALDYGNRATGPIEDSARQLAAFVDRVLEATGAAKVSIVGHSQGGVMPRYYLKALGGAAKVEDMVGLAPPNHGTSQPLAPPVGFVGLCTACLQLATGSAFLTNLNAGDETPGEVAYTQIATTQDVLVLPYTSAFLAGSPSQVTNVTLQHTCRLHVVDHSQMAFDPVTLQWVTHALARPGPADPAFRPRCLLL